MKTITVKQAFESDNIVITKISQGNRCNVRIDARTRFHVADGINFLSKWVSLTYANRLAVTNYGKKVNEFNCFQY